MKSTAANRDIRTGQNGTKPGLQLIPQPHGGALLNGGLPGNIGGTGRPPSEIRKKLADILEEFGPDVVRDILTGKLKYNFVGTCSKCGEESEGPTTISEILEQFKGSVPTPDVRLRAVEAANKIAYGEKIVLTMAHPDVLHRLGLLRELIQSRETWETADLIQEITVKVFYD